MKYDSIDEEFEDEAGIIMECPFFLVTEVKNQEAVQLLKKATGLDVGESEAFVLYEEQN